MAQKPQGNVPVDWQSSVPLWVQVHNDLQRRCRRGEFKHSCPAEADLARQYGVSRPTVREALRHLRESGRTDVPAGRRRLRAATTDRRSAADTLYHLFDAIDAAGHSRRSVVRALDKRTDGTVAWRLGLEESAALVHLERVWIIDEEPLAIDRVWLPAQIAAPLLEADFAYASVYGELERRCGVRPTGGYGLVQAIVPTAAEQALLDMPATTAVLLEHTGELRGRPVEWRSTIVRGDRYLRLIGRSQLVPEARATRRVLPDEPERKRFTRIRSLSRQSSEDASSSPGA